MKWLKRTPTYKFIFITVISDQLLITNFNNLRLTSCMQAIYVTSNWFFRKCFTSMWIGLMELYAFKKRAILKVFLTLLFVFNCFKRTIQEFLAKAFVHSPFQGCTLPYWLSWMIYLPILKRVVSGLDFTSVSRLRNASCHIKWYAPDWTHARNMDYIRAKYDKNYKWEQCVQIELRPKP